MMIKKMISSERIVKSYGAGNEKRSVLDGVSIGVDKGEFVSIMGPSGCGKSTLLFAMSSMDSIDRGTILFDDKVLTDFNDTQLADLRRTKMGFVFQQPTMLKNLNILDNIILPAVSGNRKNNHKIIEKAKLLMEKVGIANLANRDIAQVSGGQLQRAGICRALIAQPEIIFVDEPTGALNCKSADEIMDILASIHAEGTAILLVTHDAKVAACSQRILFMRDGKIVSKLPLPKYSGKDNESRIKTILEKMQEIGI